MMERCGCNPGEYRVEVAAVNESDSAAVAASSKRPVARCVDRLSVSAAAAASRRTIELATAPTTVLVGPSACMGKAAREARVT